MPNPVETLLTSIGLPSEDIQAITTLPEDKQATFDPAPYVGKVKDNYQTQLKNDANFFNELTVDKLPKDVKKRLESEQYGRASNIVKDKALKSFGMTEAEFEDLPEDQRQKLETFMPILAERYTKTKAGDKQLQNELIEARKKLEAFDGIEEKIKTKYESESNQKITDVISNANILSALANIHGLKIKPSTLAREAKDILNSKYALERVGDFGVELRQKANTQMKVLKEGSSQELSLSEALSEIAVSEGWVEKKTEGGESGSGKLTVTPSGNGSLKMVAPHIADKISNKIASEK